MYTVTLELPKHSENNRIQSIQSQCRPSYLSNRILNTDKQNISKACSLNVPTCKLLDIAYLLGNRFPSL